MHEDFRGRLWLYAWREQWERNLADPTFAAEFGRYTARLDLAMEQLLRTLEALTAEGASLTLLNVDLIPEHIRLWNNRPFFIDWEQAAYGSLYLNLPNHFTVETALSIVMHWPRMATRYRHPSFWSAITKSGAIWDCAISAILVGLGARRRAARGGAVVSLLYFQIGASWALNYCDR